MLSYPSGSVLVQESEKNEVTREQWSDYPEVGLPYFCPASFGSVSDKNKKQVQKTKIPSDTMISNMMSVERLDSNNPHWASEVFVRALKWTILLFPTIETFLSAQFPFIWKEKAFGSA